MATPGRLILAAVVASTVLAGTAPAETARCASDGRDAQGLVLIQAERRLGKKDGAPPPLAAAAATPDPSWQQEGHALLHRLGQRAASALALVVRARTAGLGNITDGPAEVIDGPVEVVPGAADYADLYKKPTMWDITMYSLLWGVVFLIFTCVVALVYLRLKEAPRPELVEQQLETHGFQFGIFDTTKCSFGLCFLSFCCCPLRWADTVSQEKLKIISFWPALLLVASLIAFGNIPYLGGILSLVLLGVVMYFRQSIRSHYGIDRGTCMTLAEDCLCYTFCAPCLVAQEARQVEYVEAKP